MGIAVTISKVRGQSSRSERGKNALFRWRHIDRQYAVKDHLVVLI